MANIFGDNGSPINYLFVIVGAFFILGSIGAMMSQSDASLSETADSSSNKLFISLMPVIFVLAFVLLVIGAIKILLFLLSVVVLVSIAPNLTDVLADVTSGISGDNPVLFVIVILVMVLILAPFVYLIFSYAKEKILGG